jgi:hypothetical protein
MLAVIEHCLSTTVVGMTDALLGLHIGSRGRGLSPSTLRAMSSGGRRRFVLLWSLQVSVR